VTTSAATTPTGGGAPAPPSANATRGWYLYGITRRGPLAALLAEADEGPGFASTAAPREPAPLQLLEFSELAAVVRPVLLAEFSQAILQERSRSATALEEMVRSHNRVIEAVHARQAILPAKFGSVYADTRDVASALRPAHDSLLRQLDRLEGCDEWAVHLFADPAIVRERISADDPGIRRLRDESAAGGAGEELEAAAQHTLVTLAQRVFDRLAGHAVAGQVSPPGPATGPGGEPEILRAAFLVARDAATRFEEEVYSAIDASAGLRCDYSGPWPPYSFAVPEGEEGR
jgi:hypothetical protein